MDFGPDGKGKGGTVLRVLAWTFALLLFGISSLSAQEGASLTEVEALLAQGSISEARATLENWWTARFSSSSRIDRQRGIWLRGKLTVDPSMAELDFRRLVVEFPGGPFSDDALFRLGLSAEFRGDLRAAQGSFESLLRDYPSSPRVAEAQVWVRTHAQATARLPRVPDTPAVGAPPPGSATSTFPRNETGLFAVQVGAFRSLDRALSVSRQLRAAGFQPRVVRTPGNDLARVRVGRFTLREDTAALILELETRGFEVTLAMDAESEERVGKPSTLGE